MATSKIAVDRVLSTPQKTYSTWPTFKVRKPIANWSWINTTMKAYSNSIIVCSSKMAPIPQHHTSDPKHLTLNQLFRSKSGRWKLPVSPENLEWWTPTWCLPNYNKWVSGGIRWVLERVRLQPLLPKHQLRLIRASLSIAEVTSSDHTLKSIYIENLFCSLLVTCWILVVFFFF